MPAILVDSNVLLDLMIEDARWSPWAAEAVKRAADRSRLVINAIVYAEVSVRYSRIEDPEAALPTEMLEREAVPYEAAFLAGKVFLRSRQQGGTKRSPLPDFRSKLLEQPESDGVSPSGPQFPSVSPERRVSAG
jgi:predicted nucleic acid-binding protein